jgi:hypothetical protein
MKILNINSKREDSLQLDPEAENSSNRNKLLQNKTKFISFGKSACIVSDKFNSISIIPYQSNCIEIVIDFHERITMILASLNSDSLFIGSCSGEVVRADLSIRKSKFMTQSILTSSSESRVNELKLCDNENFLVVLFNDNVVSAVFLPTWKTFQVLEDEVVVSLEPVDNKCCIFTQNYLLYVFRLASDACFMIFSVNLKSFRSLPMIKTFQSGSDSMLIFACEKKIFFYRMPLTSDDFLDSVRQKRFKIEAEDKVKLNCPVSKMIIFDETRIIVMNLLGELIMIWKNPFEKGSKFRWKKMNLEGSRIQDFCLENLEVFAITEENRIVSHEIINF